MFLRSSCSRNECGAPEGSENYSSRRQHIVRRFASSGLYIESTESDVSGLQDSAHSHHCHHHHHHENFTHNESFSRLSNKSISPISKVSKESNENSFKNGESSFNLRSRSHDSRKSCSRDSRRSSRYDSRISSSDTLNYSYSEFNDTMPISDVMDVANKHNSGYSNRRLSSTPICEHQFLSSSKFWKALNSFKRPGIHDSNAGNCTSQSKAKYSKKCYNNTVHWFEKASHFNASAILPCFKAFGTKKIVILLILLFLAAFYYMYQGNNPLQLLKPFPIDGIKYLLKAFPFFIPFQNDLSLASSLTFEQKKISHISSPPDGLSFNQEFNVSEIKLLVTKLIQQELDDLQLFKNWQDEKFFLRQEIGHIQKEFAEFKLEFEMLLDPLKDIAKLSDKLQGLETFSKQERDKLNKKLGSIEKSIIELNASDQETSLSYKDITRKIYMLQHDITSFVKNLDQNSTTFQKLLPIDFIHTEVPKLHLAVQRTTITLQEMKNHIEFLQLELENIKLKNGNQHTIVDMEEKIKNSILLYDADKTGQVDYALESAGGVVVKNSPSYMELSTILGFRLWTCASSGPKLAIHPSTYPGHCWAMKGSQGFIVIKLAHTIWPTGFVVEHAPMSIIPPGNMNSAPKAFGVYGLSSEDIVGNLLGNYSFDINGNPLQYFPVQFKVDLPFNYVELKIYSNYGNFNYTCLYRFRVHGMRYTGERFW